MLLPAVLLCVLATSVQAEDFGELEGSEHSPTFTAAERKLFVDAVARFTKHEVPYKYFDGSPFWLDDEHLVFSSRDYPGWAAQANEPPRIIVYNVISGKIKDSGYRGRLDCMNHLGDFMLRLPTKREGLSFAPENFRWFVGRWGQPPQEITYNPSASVPSYLCRYVPFGEAIFSYPPEELPPQAAQVTPLLPGHGSLRVTVLRVGEGLVEYLHLIKTDGTAVLVRNSRLRAHNLVFHPWRDTYFENGTTSNPPTVITPSGEQMTYSIPRLIRFWRGRNVARGGVFGSREGVLWAVQKSRGLWRKQGVYLDTGRELFRVSDAGVTGGIITSPGGCKVFWGAYLGDLSNFDSKRQIVVTDICKGIYQ